MQHCGKDSGLITETHLGLGGMHIHIHLGGVHLHKENNLRIVPAGQTALVGLAHSCKQALVRHDAPVDVQQYAIPAQLGHLGKRRKAVSPDAVPLPVKGVQRLHNQLRPDDGKACPHVLPRQKAQAFALAAGCRSRRQPKTDFRSCQRKTCQPFLRALEFRGRSL